MVCIPFIRSIPNICTCLHTNNAPIVLNNYHYVRTNKRLTNQEELKIPLFLYLDINIKVC